jgi:hypothetical protein
MKSNFQGGGPFDPPSGQALVEIPDGNTRTYGGGSTANSLTNADFAHGGPDGCGWGAFPIENTDGTGEMAILFNPRGGSRFRVG